MRSEFTISKGDVQDRTLRILRSCGGSLRGWLRLASAARRASAAGRLDHFAAVNKPGRQALPVVSYDDCLRLAEGVRRGQ
jgi:hypothetical protein